MEANFGCSLGDIEFSCNFAVAHAMHISKDHNIAQPLRKIVERSAQPLSNGPIFEREFWIIGLATISQVNDGIDVIVARMTLAAAHVGRRTVRRNAMQPC